MRTRMSGGVGRVIREDDPYPIYVPRITKDVNLRATHQEFYSLVASVEA